MPIVRILLLLVALVSPALAQGGDGPRDAAAAKEAAQAFRQYVEGIAKTGGRPDLTRPEVATLLHRVFDLDALAALPPARASDVAWLLEWGETANRTSKLFMLYGAKPGAAPDEAAIQRNLVEYEDQYAAAMNFTIRFQARQAIALNLFMASLAPEQRTPVREAGLTRARSGAAGIIQNVIGALVLSGKPANARLAAAAIKDTRDVWATYLLPKDRMQLVQILADLPKTVKDDAARTDLAAFAVALQAAI